jgi:hypothetical protein
MLVGMALLCCVVFTVYMLSISMVYVQYTLQFAPETKWT